MALSALVEELATTSEERRLDMIGVYFRLREIRESSSPESVVPSRPPVWPRVLEIGVLLGLLAGGIFVMLEWRAARAERSSVQSTLDITQSKYTEAERGRVAIADRLEKANATIDKYREDEAKRKSVPVARENECLEKQTLEEFDAMCAGYVASTLVAKRAALVDKKTAELVAKDKLTASEAAAMLKLKPSDVRALIVFFNTVQPTIRPTSKECTDIATYAAHVLALSPQVTDLAAIARKKRIACTPVPERGGLLADWYESTREQGPLKDLFALDVDAGIAAMEKMNEASNVMCGVLMSITGGNRLQIADYQRRYKCGGMAKLEVSAEADVCISVCEEGAAGCGCDVPAAVKVGQYDTLKKYNTYAQWYVDGKLVNSEPIQMNLESGITNFLSVREARIALDGRGEGKVEVAPKPGTSISCDLEGTKRTCSAGFLVRQRNVAVTLKATPKTVDDLFLGWSGACTSDPTCEMRLESSRQLITARFGKRPLVRPAAGILLDGAACIDACRVDVGSHELTVAPQAGKVTVWNGCNSVTEGKCKLTTRADAEHVVSVAFEDK